MLVDIINTHNFYSEYDFLNTSEFYYIYFFPLCLWEEYIYTLVWLICAQCKYKMQILINVQMFTVSGHNKAKWQ